MSIPLVKGTIAILFSKKKTTISEIIVAIINGIIANFRLWLLPKYTIKKISRGPKSVKNLIIGLFMWKLLTYVSPKMYFLLLIFLKIYLILNII